MTHLENIEQLQATAINNYIDGLVKTAQQQTVTVERELTTTRQQLTEAQTTIGTRERTITELTSKATRLETELADLRKKQAGYREGWGNAWFEDTFENLDNWNVRHNFTTIDTARGVKENATVDNGGLHLKGTWLPTPLNAGPQGTITHNTGYVDQRKLVDTANPTPVQLSQKFGRWEIRAKTPTGPNTRGALAAIWLRADNHQGEIDIMEAWGGGGTMHADWTRYIKDSAVTTIHSSTNSAAVNGKGYRKTFWRHWEHGGPKPVWADFHTYAFERTPTYMATFVDDIEIFRVTPASPDPVNKAGSAVNPAGTLAWMWDEDFWGSPLHLRLNLHVGPSASYWGVPDPASRQHTVDPLDFQIEYVRMWALPA